MSEHFPDIIAWLRWLQSPEARRQIHGAAAIAMEREAKLGFRNEEDPYGVAWLPSRRAIEEGGQTLVDEGFLRASIAKKFGVDEAEVMFTREYGWYHQNAEPPRVQRKIVPDQDADMPPKWRDAIDEDVTKVINRRRPR